MDSNQITSTTAVSSADSSIVTTERNTQDEKPHVFIMTPRLATQMLGYRRYEIAANHGVTSRQQIHNILTGKSSHPKLLCALHEELMRIKKVEEEMGIRRFRNIS